MTPLIPDDYAPLLLDPNYGHLGTVRPDGGVQVNPMWYEFDGEFLRFTHTTKRAKFRNLQHNPAMSLSVLDPNDPFRYLEVRGRLVDVVPDPTGAFYVHLAERYDDPDRDAPADKADRVILVMNIEKTTQN
jgi:PPOX class probable F420-dependent enzyme